MNRILCKILETLYIVKNSCIDPRYLCYMNSSGDLVKARQRGPDIRKDISEKIPNRKH